MANGALASPTTPPTFPAFPTPAPHACCADGTQPCTTPTSAPTQNLGKPGKAPIFDIDLIPAVVGANIANSVWVDCEAVAGYLPLFSICVTGEYIDSSASTLLTGREHRRPRAEPSAHHSPSPAHDTMSSLPDLQARTQPGRSSRSASIAARRCARAKTWLCRSHRQRRR